MKKTLFAGLILVFFPLYVLAEGTDTSSEVKNPDKIRYVTDQLQLSMYPQANNKGGVLMRLTSGDRVEILETTRYYALVVASGGQQGWVKRVFLVPEPTSNLLLEEQKKLNQNLVTQIETLSNSKIVIDQYERDMDGLTEKLEIAEAAKAKAEEKVAILEQKALKTEESSTLASIEPQPMVGSPVHLLIDTFLVHWRYLIPTGLALVLLGCIIMKMIFDARIRRRFHGLKLW